MVKVKAARVSLLEERDHEMKNALAKVREVFKKYATSSPRLIALHDAPNEMKDMQIQSYRIGSRSRGSEAFFMDMKTFKWEVGSLTLSKPRLGFEADA